MSIFFCSLRIPQNESIFFEKTVHYGHILKIRKRDGYMMNLYDAIFQGIMTGNVQQTALECRKLLDQNIDPRDILDHSLIPAMDRLDTMLTCGERFIPQILLSAKAMQRAVDLLGSAMMEQHQAPLSQGTVVLGTVQGDIHNIGKNLVDFLLQSVGFHVVDLGVNVSAEQFIEAVRRHGARIVALSAMLTSSMVSMRAVVQRLQQEDFGYPVRIIVGGNPITANFARSIHACFAGNIIETMHLALEFAEEAGNGQES